MRKINCPKVFFIIAFIIFSLKGFSQLSKTHYIPPLTYGDFNSGVPDTQYMYLSTPSTANVTYRVTAIGQTAPFASGTLLSNSSPQEIALDTGSGQLFMLSSQTSTITSNKGYIVEASAPIYVSVRVNAFAQAGSLVSKGLSALGQTFRTGNFTTASPLGSALSAYMNFVSVMAAEDDTQITFGDLPTGLIIENYSGPIPIPTITLNRGESYILAVDYRGSQDLIGCLVTSNKDIVVNCGSTVGSFGTGGGRDYGFDQIVDLSKVGDEYIFVHGARRISGTGADNSDRWETVLIVAHTDNTSIFVNGNATPIATINAGEFYPIKGDSFDANDNMYVRTSAPVYAYQGVGGLNDRGTPAESNQGLFLVPPLSCETRGNIENIASIDRIGPTPYSGGISIVAESGASVTVNGFPIANLSAFGFIVHGPHLVTTADPSKSYDAYKILNLSGNVSVATASGGELYCAYFNYNGNATSGAFYSGFTSNPEVVFDLTTSSLGLCVPNVKLDVSSPGSFDNFEWFEDPDGDGLFTTTGITGISFSPSIPGTYRVTGSFSTCSTDTFDSEDITIGDCSDRDIDLDGIVNNIDIDNDNDGILDCTESYGNKTIDLLNPTDNAQDKIAFFGYTYNSIANPTSAYTLGNDGTFTSDTPVFDGFTESSTTFQVTFNNPLNLLIEYNSSGSILLSDDEEFVISSPLNRSFTLVNPSDQVLVDTDLDGVYESGITEFTSIEIRFKLNGTSNTDDFKFYAYSLDSFTYKHINTSQTSNNQAAFKVSATCLFKDSDNDGINDALDLDSDNDGIPDYIESLGANYVNPSTPNYTDDTNSDGLFDVFNTTSGTPPIDTDTDGVLDYLDLDSDNDGIYDVEESGSNLPDTNFDGIIDNILTTIGTNGWDDNAETTPDNNLINYTVNDVDADTFFTYIDLDSDADGCSDVIEANFTDGNGNNLLGNTTPTVDASGKVNNATDGYTGTPNNAYITAGTLITITNQPVNDNICTSSNTMFTVNTDANIFQWEVSSDNGTSWTTLTNNVVDGATYSGVTTNTLNISNTPNSFNSYQYRALLNITGNTCGGIYTDTATLTVNPFISLPSSLSPLELCDDSTNNGTENFNLVGKNDAILGIPNPTGYTVTYYTDPTRSAPFEITGNTTSYPSIGETIYVTVTGPAGCPPNMNLQFDLIVNPFPSTGIVANYELCDDDTDGVQIFILDFLDTTILGTQSPTDYAVKYYLASDGSEITNTVSYENRTRNREAIIARVIGPGGCFGNDVPFDLIVHPIPNISTNLRIAVCDGDAGDDSTDGIYPFDTSSMESDILNGTNPASVTTYYTYTNSSGAFVIDATSLPNPLVTVSQSITVRVESNTLSNSISGQACYSQIDIPFIVSEQPVANPIAPIEVCDGDAGDDDADGMYPFNTSTFEDDILNGQTSMIVYYTYIDESGAQVNKSRFLPDPLRSGTQTILVEVENFTNTNCSDSTNIDLTVNLLPGFTISAQTPICNSTPGSVVTLDPEEDDLTEVYTYQWINLANPSAVLATTNTYDASIAGTYNVTLTKTDGTGCSRSRDVEVIESEIATITIANVEINDTSENNSVKVINETILGIGDYEYALEEESLTIDDEVTFDYQDDSSFYNVRAGFYNLWIRDRNGCGTSTPLHIAVVGYVKYFTPNGDNQNDYWQIQGVNDLIKPSSNILIYDRYGKLLKQVDPLGPGWDGTLNGQMLPTDDYWFRVHLLDGTSFMGHFTLKR